MKCIEGGKKTLVKFVKQAKKNYEGKNKNKPRNQNASDIKQRSIRSEKVRNFEKPSINRCINFKISTDPVEH